jgi:hypothetical protein
MAITAIEIEEPEENNIEVTKTNIPGDENNGNPIPKTTMQQMNKQKRLAEEHQRKKQLNMAGVDDVFLKMARPADPYEFIDKKTQKIEINAGIPYKSTSQAEVFEPRIFENKARHLASVNQYI